MAPVDANYLATMTVASQAASPAFSTRGVAVLDGNAQSLAGRIWRQVAAVLVRESGFYAANPGADIPVAQLLRGGGQMTGNSRGIRLGGFVEIRTIMQEEMERALQGQQGARAALDASVTRGNVVLRNFERTSRG